MQTCVKREKGSKEVLLPWPAWRREGVFDKRAGTALLSNTPSRRQAGQGSSTFFEAAFSPFYARLLCLRSPVLLLPPPPVPRPPPPATSTEPTATMMLGVASPFSSSEDQDQAPACEKEARTAVGATADAVAASAAAPAGALKQGQALLLQAHDRVVGTLTVTDTEATFVAGKITVTVPLSEDPHLRGGQIDLLPDRARRSRHQDNLFPLALLAPEPEGDPEAPRIELVVAFETGSEMWEWAEALRCQRN